MTAIIATLCLTIFFVGSVCQKQAEAIAALQAENERLTTALEWYADKDNYWARLEKAALVLVDHGKRATKALKP